MVQKFGLVRIAWIWNSSLGSLHHWNPPGQAQSWLINFKSTSGDVGALWHMIIGLKHLFVYLFSTVLFWSLSGLSEWSSSSRKELLLELTNTWMKGVLRWPFQFVEDRCWSLRGKCWFADMRMQCNRMTKVMVKELWKYLENIVTLRPCCQQAISASEET